MGTTLTNGVYLPNEGERNCYAGLKTNWEILDQKVADVTALQQAVAGALHREIVESLPTTDINPNTIYMILSGTSATENVYNEFMYVNNAWELIGTSATDLTNYYTKAEVDGKLLLKANDSDVVHKSGNETIAGNKTFNDLQIIGYGTQYKGARNAYILPEFGAGYSGLSITTLGYSQTLKIGNFVLDANNKPSLDTSKGYIQVATGESNGVNACVLEARNTTSSSLGTSSNKWSGIYATNYYYGNDNVEFSSKFVTTDTNQTISGVKTFTDDIIKGYTTITSRTIKGFGYSNTTGLNGNGFIQLQANLIYNDSTPSRQVTVSLEILENAYTDGKSSAFYSNSNNLTNLGKSGKRWANVYATNYYYGSSETEFSQKFVTTDTVQTVSGSKTFSSTVNVYNSDNTADIAHIVLKNAKAEKGGSLADSQIIYFIDNMARSLATIRCQVGLNGQSTLTFRTDNVDSSNNPIYCGMTFSANKNGTKNIVPNTNGDTDFGTVTTKWKSFNGLEPSSLSLPSSRDSRVDISSYITNLGNGDNNSYTVPANGYIWLHFTSINSALCYSQTSGGLTNYAQTFVRYQGDGQLYAFFPVRKNDVFIVQIYTSSTAVVQNAYFIPCQGNV